MYSHNKIIHHPQALKNLREQTPCPPIHIHFMPMLRCNHHCRFCAYGHRTSDDGPEQFDWKNMSLMSDTFMPEEKMIECVRDWVGLGVKAVEITGGGEPLLYPHIDSFLKLIRETSIEWALVSNGTGLTKKRAQLLRGFTWARISIDAGTEQTYTSTHRCDPRHWKLAWAAVDNLSQHKTHKQARIGVSYIVDQTNWNELYACAEKAKKAGADNIRFALAFTPQHLQRFPPGALDEAATQAQAAQNDFGDHAFQVISLLANRRDALLAPSQDYSFCGMKEVTCVVAGDLNVYTCCSLAFNQKGLIGSIRDCSFKELWDSSAKNAFFAQHNPKLHCKNSCVFDSRNKAILALLSSETAENIDQDTQQTHLHINFL